MPAYKINAKGRCALLIAVGLIVLSPMVHALASPQVGSMQTQRGDVPWLQIQGQPKSQEMVHLKAELFRFYRRILAEETAHLSDADVHVRLEQAIADTIRLGANRERDVISMSAVRMFRADIVDDAWYWNAVMNHETNNALMRAGLFLAYVKHDMPPDVREDFEARLGIFGLKGLY